MPFTTAEVTKRSGKRTRSKIDLFGFYIFPQVRGEEPDEIDVSDLTPSIISQGLFTPPLVAVFNQDGFVEYVELTNKLHKCSLRPDDYEPNYRKRLWLVLVYGHRRMVACRNIHQNFAEECIELCATPDGKESLRLIQSGQVEADFIANPEAKVAKKMQLEENRHVGVEAYKEARIIGELFRLSQVYNPELTITEFIREYTGQFSDDRVRDALRFYSLPKLVQDAVTAGVIRYGHSVQIGRYLSEIKPKDLDDKALELLGKVINDQPNVSEFTLWITQRIEDTKNATRQLDMAELMGGQSTVRERLRKQTNASTKRDLGKIVLHVRGMAFLCEKAILGLSDSPLLDEGNATKVKLSIELLEQVARQFETLVPIVRDPAIPNMRNLIKLLEKLEKAQANKTLKLGGSLADKLDQMIKGST